MNIGSYLLANTYSAFSPVLNLASSFCSINGKQVDCSNINFTGIFGFSFLLICIISLIILVLIIVSVWKVFVKAGQPGWACIIPIFNVIVLLQIVKKPIWWIILMFIPLVSVIFGFILSNEIAKAFGKGIGFTIGLIFLPFIFFPILGFGSSSYLLSDKVN